MNSIRPSNISLVFMLFLTALSGCKSTPPENVISIGANFPLTGIYSAEGTASIQGVRMAVEEMNASGGVKGQLLRLVEADNAGQAVLAANHALAMQRDHVVAIVGGFSSNLADVESVMTERLGIPLISAQATRTDLPAKHSSFYRVCFADTFQGAAAASYAYNQLKRSRAAIVWSAQDSYSVGLAKDFKENFIRLGGTISAEKPYPTGETNFTTYLSQIQSESPDVVFAPVRDKDMVNIARQGQPLGLKGDLFLGGDGWGSPELLEGAAAQLEGAAFIDHFSPDMPRPQSQAFVAAYREKFGMLPTSYAILAYDATRVLADAISRAPRGTGAEVNQALAQTHGFEGATGTISIDANHNTVKPAVLVKVSQGKFVFGGFVEP